MHPAPCNIQQGRGISEGLKGHGDRRPPGRSPFRDPQRSRELGRPWWVRGLGRPWRIRELCGPWWVSPNPPKKISKSGGHSGRAGTGGGSADYWGHSGSADSWGGALWKRGLLGGALETQTQHSAFEGLALEGAVEERALELGSNSYPYMPPARHMSVCRRACGGRRACVGHGRQTCVVHGWQTCVGRVCIRIFIFHTLGLEPTGLPQEQLAGLMAGCSGSGPDTPQTPEGPFLPTKSHGVWEVHGAMEVSPKPEQMIEGGIILCRCHSKLAELPSIRVANRTAVSMLQEEKKEETNTEEKRHRLWFCILGPGFTQLQHIQLSDTTGTSNGTGFNGQMKQKN